MKNFKTAVSVFLILMIVLSLAACEKKNEQAKDEPIVGGWNEQNTAPSDEEVDIFNKAVEGTDYADYTPVTLLATQVVAGRNYKFLCTDAAGAEFTVVIYRDLSDNCSVTSVEAK